MKAGLAAALVACREAASLGLAGDVVVAAVADEEHASLGVQDVLEVVSADAAVVTEPTEMALVDRAPGLRLVRGRGARAGGARVAAAPRRRRDRQDRADPDRARRPRRAGSTSGATRCSARPSVHASLIEGGEELSSYPARCVVGIERRTLPGETRA